MFHKDARALAAGLRRFTADLYHRLAADKGNLFFSPLSIASALLLVHAGARGETRREIERALGIDLPQDRLLDAFSRLDAELAERDFRYEPPTETIDLPIQLRTSPFQPGEYLCRLKSSAGLWLQETYPCEDSYLTISREVFGADRQSVDFQADPGTAAAVINGWVKEQTEGLIERVIDPAAIHPLTRLVLASATYFKASWLFRFKKHRTKPAPFHRLDAPPIDLDMMEQIAQLPYVRHDECQAVDLYYESPHLRFVIVLPDTGTFDGFDRSLEQDRLDELLFGGSETTMAKVRLKLPRFRLEADVDLALRLADIGIQALFGDQADLSGLSAEPGLHLDRILHKAVVSVDEDGTEAAAVTFAAAAGGIEPSDEPIDVTCDRPFLFFIVDKPTRTILFAGRLMDPEDAGAV